ncbi:MAG: flagellar biosynthesis protein FlhF [Magnetococcales bacterium]|nr:flagellar biosynthesis protein FlhF [Magnetococcales bacterium]
MQISTFQAQTMREALDEVKEKLGVDAVILSTRSIREKGKGMMPTGRTLIEVTACASVARDQRDQESSGREERSSVAEPAPRRSRFSSVPADEPPIASPTAPPVAPPVAAVAGDPVVAQAERRLAASPAEVGAADPLQQNTVVQALASDLSTIRKTLASLEERFSATPQPPSTALTGSDAGSDTGSDANNEMSSWNVEARRRYSYLMMHGVEEPIARKLVQIEQADQEGGGLKAALQRFLDFRDPLVGGSDSGRIIALVGPTGVGKTTTLAKIAADLLLRRQRSVGMITLDTFRVGAVAQLETYAKLLQVRLIVARSLADIRAGMQSLSRCDHILVDTVGSSPYNRRQVNSTGALLPVMGEEREVLLCMAGNVRETEQQAIYRRFATLQPTGLIFTKLDETMTYGGILNVALRARLPLTLYTDGQRVPENLGWLSAETMTQWFEQPQSQQE